MASSRRHVTYADWRGGLVLPRNEAAAVTAQGRENELLEATGVDILRSGGVTRRRRASAFGDPLPAAGECLMLWESLTTGAVQPLVAVGTSIYRGTFGGAWASIGMTQTASTGPYNRGVQFNGKVYIANSHDNAIRWDGTTATRLTTGFNDNLAAPAGGKFPKAHVMTVHQGSVFVVDADATASPPISNRLRWSHPNQAEDWRTNDYIDVDIGRRGDFITALASVGDRLLIFKRSGIYALLGFDADTYQVVQLAEGVGARAFNSAFSDRQYQGRNTAIGGGIVYFADTAGIYAVSGNGSTVELNPLTAGDATPGGESVFGENVLDMAYFRNRLWVATFHGIFNYDPALKAWVQWDERACTFIRASASNLYALGDPTTESTQVLLLERDNQSTDLVPLATPKDFVSAISTVWIDLGKPSVKKRWKAPKIRVNAPSVGFQFNVTAYADFSSGGLYSTTVTCAAAGTQFLTGLSGMGSARAVRLRVSAVTQAGDYVIDSITLPYTLRDSR